MLELSILAISVLANVLVGLIALVKNSRSHTNQLFALLAFALSAWSAASYVSVNAEPNAALLYIRLTMFFVVTMNSAFFFLVQTFPRPHLKLTRPLLAITFFCCLTAIAALSPFLFTHITNSASGSVSPVPGPAIPLFLIHAVTTVLGGSILLVRRFRKSTGLERAQIRFLLYGTALLFTLVPLTNFVLPVAFNESELIILSPLYTVVFALATGYAIIKHRLLDVRAIIAKSLSYVLLLLVLAGLYVGVAYSVSSLFFSNNLSFLQQSYFNGLLAVILAFTFQPLRNLFDRVTDRVFYRDHYDSQTVVNNITQIAASEIHLEKLLDLTLAEICRSMKVMRGMFMVFNHGKIYKVAHFGPLPDRIIVVPELRKLNRTVLIADELPEGERKDILDHHSIRLSLAMRTKEEFVGFLLLGDKLSGDMYTEQDLRLLQILTKELAVAFSNAKAYEEIAQFNATLQGKVQQATAKLRQANINLKALDKVKDEFISLTSHQLRTPLTTVKGYLSMIAEGDAGKVTPAQSQFLGYAIEGTQRMVSLISDLLNVSRMSAGRFMLDRHPVDLVQMVADETRQLQSRASAKNLPLKFVAPHTKLPLFSLDEGKTRQVIMNFIDNAIYYTPSGLVTVAVKPAGQSVRVEITDTGIGVPKAEQAKLFAKFYRAHNAQIVRPDGTGLGLYMAKRVIEAQGGKIIFDSVMNQGSTFGFELPLPARRKPASTTRRPRTPAKITA
jgi:signal transduction histidine kinase